MTSLFLILFIAHLMGDFCMQFNWVFRWKVKNGYGIAVHVLMHLVITAVLIEAPWHSPSLFLLLGSIHYVTDWAKLQGSVTHARRDFWLDQITHTMTLLLLVILFPAVRPAVESGTLIWLATAVGISTLCTLSAILPPLYHRRDLGIPAAPMLKTAQCLGSGAFFAAVVPLVFS